ncbi:phosphatase PAP2 family protein [Nocardia sp. NPDC051570]|uniref:phosphatase PAP2 family protein n=1 Tax=Nocardia sp. NPDC051570 TaxID=3364324 RepID=UPI003790CBF0
MALLAAILLSAVAAVALVHRGILRWPGACTLIMVAALITGSVELVRAAIDTRDGSTELDAAALNWTISHRAGWLTPTAEAFSTLGGPVTMLAVTLAACAWLARQRRWPAVLLTAVVAGGAGVLGSTMKSAIDRHRPPDIDHLVTVADSSFPSGHTLGSTAVVGALAALTVLSTCDRVIKIAVSIEAALFIVAVGLSRVYLGVHWLTDVLAGWSIGILWLTTCLTCYLRFRHPAPTPSADSSDRQPTHR